MEEIDDDKNTASISDKTKKARRYIIEDDSEDDDISSVPQSDQPSVPTKRTRKVCTSLILSHFTNSSYTQVGKRNPIYYFYEEVLLNAEGETWETRGISTSSAITVTAKF